MRAFLLNRLSQSLVLLVIVSVIGFVILNLIPGGPMAQYGLDPGMTQADLERLKEQLGLNRPLWVQYFDWAWRLVQGDWGHSFRDGAPVLEVIGRHVFQRGVARTLLLHDRHGDLGQVVEHQVVDRAALHLPPGSVELVAPEPLPTGDADLVSHLRVR